MMGTRSYHAYGYYAHVLYMYVSTHMDMYIFLVLNAVLILHVFLLSEYLLYA